MHLVNLNIYILLSYQLRKSLQCDYFLVSGLCDEDHVIYQLLCCFNIGIQSSLVGNKSHSPANADRIIITKFGRGHV